MKAGDLKNPNPFEFFKSDLPLQSYEGFCIVNLTNFGERRIGDKSFSFFIFAKQGHGTNPVTPLVNTQSNLVNILIV